MFATKSLKPFHPVPEDMQRCSLAGPTYNSLLQTNNDRQLVQAHHNLNHHSLWDAWKMVNGCLWFQTRLISKILYVYGWKRLLYTVVWNWDRFKWSGNQTAMLPLLVAAVVSVWRVLETWSGLHGERSIKGKMNFRTGSIAITDGLYEVVTTAAWDLWSMSRWNYWRFWLHWLVTITCV